MCVFTARDSLTTTIYSFNEIIFRGKYSRQVVKYVVNFSVAKDRWQIMCE